MKKIYIIKNKILVVIILFFLLFCLTGCNIKETETYSVIMARKEAKSYFEYLKEKDISNLNKSFSKNAQKTHNLKSEWDEFFDSIDGNIVSYGRLKVGSRELWVDDGKTTKLIIKVEFFDIKTDTGRIYKRLGWELTNIDVNNREKEGINNFFMILTTDNDGFYQCVTVGKIE